MASDDKAMHLFLMKDHASCVIDGHANLIWTRFSRKFEVEEEKH